MRALAAVNGHIHTLDDETPAAQALLSLNGRVVLTGTTDAVRDGAASLTRVGARVEEFDLAGATAVPGLTDSHIHFVTYGLNLDQVVLGEARSLAEATRAVAAHARTLQEGEWVEGWGWDHSLWAEPKFPNKHALDAAVPDVPVALNRKDGHLMWVNSLVLRRAGITSQTPDPPGGRIGRDESGEPDGLLYESAQRLVERVMPAIDAERATRAARKAQTALHRMGVTGIHIPEEPSTFKALQTLDAGGELALRACIMLTLDGLDEALSTGLQTGFGSAFLTVGPVKIFADGSLGSETAAMLEPFEGSQNDGILTVSPDEIEGAIERAARGGIAAAIHAIGDKANRVVLNAFERTRGEWAPRGLRQRIEHVQVLHKDDVARLGQIGIIASVQPVHATQDMDLVDSLWGARGRYAYPFRSLHESGAVLAFGSDAPVETPDPLAGLVAAVTRRRADGRPASGWYPEERVSPDVALRGYTRAAALASGTERVNGRLAPGFNADFTVLSQDVLAVDANALTGTRVLATVVDGRVVFSA